MLSNNLSMFCRYWSPPQFCFNYLISKWAFSDVGLLQFVCSWNIQSWTPATGRLLKYTEHGRARCLRHQMYLYLEVSHLLRPSLKWLGKPAPLFVCTRPPAPPVCRRPEEPEPKDNLIQDPPKWTPPAPRRARDWRAGGGWLEKTRLGRSTDTGRWTFHGLLGPCRQGSSLCSGVDRAQR